MAITATTKRIILGKDLSNNDKSLEIAFNPESGEVRAFITTDVIVRGGIVLPASVSRDRRTGHAGEMNKHKITLIDPTGNVVDEIPKDSTPSKFNYVLTGEQANRAGNWILRVTYLGRRKVGFHATLLYQGITIIINNKFNAAQLEPRESMEITFNPEMGKIQAFVTPRVFSNGLPHLPPVPLGGEIRIDHEMLLLNPTGDVIEHIADNLPSLKLIRDLDDQEASGVGKWTLRVTNLGDRRMGFYTILNYPVLLRFITLPIDFINRTLNSQGINKISLFLQSSDPFGSDPAVAFALSMVAYAKALVNGEDETYDEFMDNVYAGEHNEYIPDENKLSFVDIAASPLRGILEAENVALPYHFFLQRQELDVPGPNPTASISRIWSQSVNVQLVNAATAYPNGAIDIMVDFEQSGTEIELTSPFGYPDADLKNMILHIYIGLNARYGKLICDKTIVDFPIEVDLQGIVGNIIEAFQDVSNKARDEIESAIEKFIDEKKLPQKIEEFLNDGIKEFGLVLGFTDNSKIHSVKIENNELVIKFIDD